MTVLPAKPSPAIAAALADAQTYSEAWPERMVNAVVTVLTREAPGSFRVDKMPNKPDKFDIGEYDGAILVHYLGSKYRVVPGGQPIAPQRTFDFLVHVLARGLYGGEGAPNVMEAVRLILQNRQIEGSTPLVVIEDGFAEVQGDIWTYSISFRGELPAVGRTYPHPSRFGAMP